MSPNGEGMKETFSIYSLDKMKEVVLQSYSYNGVLKNLGLVAGSTQWRALKKFIEQHEIDTKHFKGRGYREVCVSATKIPLRDVLVENSTYANTSRIKHRLIAEGYKKSLCESCGLEQWMGKDIPLQLHHINGVNDDHRLENLQILCANCHAQTETYAGRNTRVGLV